MFNGHIETRERERRSNIKGVDTTVHAGPSRMTRYNQSSSSGPNNRLSF